MADVTGDFEIHLTVPYAAPDKLAAFADKHGLKFSHIELDRGGTASQPMLTISGRGTLAQQLKLAHKWRDRFFGKMLSSHRVKIEAAPWNAGVPQSDDEAQNEPEDRYFEHHLKLLLADAGVATLIALTEIVGPHGARLSRNARRRRSDGGEERFVTQRCYRVGLVSARTQLDALAAELRARGYEIVEIEQEYVVYDNGIHLDGGWLTEDTLVNREREDRMRHAPEGSEGYPSTYRPLPQEPGIRQRAAFDPALKHFPNAYRAGEPEFSDGDRRTLWYQSRRNAMRHLLRVIADSPFAPHLVFRGLLGHLPGLFTAASVLRWSVDWDNFRDEYPGVTGDAASWQNRLALALARSFGE